ncbi:MAG TPA: SRPBCC family protein [Candidatus Omnitrophota bacterium]|nr:SRPBCC family protein [Candidatus Omnitrophota bacterium]
MSRSVFVSEQFLPYSSERVFDFFKKPENLDQVTPSNLGFKILTPSPIPMAKGTVIDYTIRLYGVPMKWQTTITDYDPPHSFTDTQVRGPYKTWIHTHHFISKDGGTLMKDEVQYEVPFGFLGDFIRSLFVRREVEKIFDYRKQVIAGLFEKGIA